MSPDFAPMEFVDLAKKGNDQYVGFDVILAKYLAKELNMKLVIDPMSFDACMAAVSTGQADLAISGFSWTAARAETFLISDYYVAGENESDQILISLADDKANFAADKADFTGLKIGAQGGSLQELLVKEQLVTKGAAIELYKDLNTAVEALKSGEIDALAVAKGNGEAFAASSDNVVLTDYYFEVEEKYKNNVILLNKNDADLLAAVNAVLDKAMKADLYDTWYEACQIYAEVKTADQLGYDDEGNKITE
jgi:polar amino acid transport system substrate-binding protein